MNILNKIGGAFLALVLIVLVVSGAKSPVGAPIVSALSDALQAVWGWVKTSIPSVPVTRGKGFVSIAAGALVVLGLVAFFDTLRFGKGFGFAVIVGAIVALLLYNPTAFA